MPGTDAPFDEAETILVPSPESRAAGETIPMKISNIRSLTFLPLLFALGACSYATKCINPGEEGYAIDGQQVYHWILSDAGRLSKAELVVGADYKTFEPISLDMGYGDWRGCHASYGKDARHAFYRQTVIEGADVETLSSSGSFVADKNYYYRGAKPMCKIELDRFQPGEKCFPLPN